MNKSAETLFLVLGVCAWVVTPVLLIGGWMRWMKASKPKTICSIFSLLGFLFATSSALLAVASLTYAHALTNGFPFYDPRLFRIYRWGALLSTVGFCLGVGGVWRKNSLRWLSPLVSFGMLAFWFLAAEGE